MEAIRAVRDKWALTHNVTHNEKRRHNATKALPTHGTVPLRSIYYEGVERRASYQLEYRARRADGEYRHVERPTMRIHTVRRKVGHWR